MAKLRYGECDFCNEQTRLGQVIVRCGRLNRTFAACHDCREKFEDAVQQLVETGDITEERVVEKPVYITQDRVITRTTMEPDGYSGFALLLAFVIGSIATAIGFCFPSFH